MWGEVSLIGTIIIYSCLFLLNHNQCPGYCATDLGFYFRGILGYAYALCEQIHPEIPESPKMSHLVYFCPGIWIWSNWNYLVCLSECKWGCIVGGRCRKKAIWWMAAIKMKQGRSSSKFVVQDTLPCAEGPYVGSDKLVESRKWITNFGSVRGGQSPVWIIKTLLHHQHCLEKERRQIWTSAQRKTESICTRFPSSQRPSPNT